MLDRIDIVIDVPRVTFEEMAENQPAESSAAIKKRVEAARALQRERFRGTNIYSNAMMSGARVKKYCNLTQDARELLKSVFKQLKLSARSHDRMLKVARTVADLAGDESIEIAHLAEAIQYRREKQGVS